LAIQVDDFKFLKLLDEVQKEKIILILNSFKEDSIDSIRIFNIKNSLTKPIKQEFLFDLISKIAKSKALEPLSGANILVVEDNELNQRVIKGVLEGNKIDIASNGKEAIDKIESNFYDVVFMDIAMPILDGYEATKLIRKKYKDLPIIGLSANTTKENRDKALKYGMNDYILKPINPTILFDILAKYVKIDGRPKPQENLNSVKILKLSNIDIEDVLHRLKYEELFLDLCNMFLKNHSDSYDKIKQAIALKEMDKAILIAHSIKGVSANLSGKALYQSSLELEKALKSGENFEKELNNFRDKLQLFIDDINEILKRQNGKNY
jgi:CheY-like chemotaxis protein